MGKVRENDPGAGTGSEAMKSHMKQLERNRVKKKKNPTLGRILQTTSVIEEQRKEGSI